MKLQNLFKRAKVQVLPSIYDFIEIDEILTLKQIALRAEGKGIPFETFNIIFTEAVTTSKLWFNDDFKHNFFYFLKREL